jgi:starvation-inducible DNA-binding protein
MQMISTVIRSSPQWAVAQEAWTIDAFDVDHLDVSEPLRACKLDQIVSSARNGGSPGRAPILEPEAGRNPWDRKIAALSTTTRIRCFPVRGQSPAERFTFYSKFRIARTLDRSRPKDGDMKDKKLKAMNMDIGISEADRKQIAQGLSALLADSYTLYLMTHNFHWNVTGPQFTSLHTMFMAQYTEQWTALDVIAERIRALGFPTPGTYKEFAELASIKEVEGVPKANDMIRHLVLAQEATARTARKLFPVVEQANDLPTADLLTQRIDVHEKTAWMLRSLLED